MTRTPGPTQRARRLLNQAAMQRTHRRSELIRFAPEQDAVTVAPLPEHPSDPSEGLRVLPTFEHPANQSA